MVSDDGDNKKGFSINDKRWWLGPDVDLEALAADERSSRKPTYVEDLERQLTEKGQLLTDYIQAHKSSVADLDQVRQRLEREQERRLQVERAKLAEPFVEVLENLQRLVEACQTSSCSDQLLQGASLVVKQLEERLDGLGLEPIEALGQSFDPNTMEAMMTTEVPAEQDGKVIEVVRPGYTLGERVVRPAGVRVGVAKRG